MDYSGPQQKLINDAIFRKQEFPRKNPDKIVHPKRYHQNDNKDFVKLCFFSQEISDRI
jgi:hypothetical protein